MVQFPKEESASGEFKRQEDTFRDWISADNSTPFPVAANRYHLYVSLACPWASRTIIARKLLELEEVIGMTVVDPVRDERGWAFRDPGAPRAVASQPMGDTSHKKDDTEAVPPSTDPVNGFHFLAEAYAATDSNFDGRVTVPVLWDRETKKIVNNCEDDICLMFNHVFRAFARNKDVELFPK